MVVGSSGCGRCLVAAVVVNTLISRLDEYARLKTLSFPVCSLIRDAVCSSPGSGASFGGGAFFDFNCLQKRKGQEG